MKPLIWIPHPFLFPVIQRSMWCLLNTFNPCFPWLAVYTLNPDNSRYRATTFWRSMSSSTSNRSIFIGYFKIKSCAFSRNAANADCSPACFHDLPYIVKEGDVGRWATDDERATDADGGAAKENKRDGAAVCNSGPGEWSTVERIRQFGCITSGVWSVAESIMEKSISGQSIREGRCSRK